MKVLSMWLGSVIAESSGLLAIASRESARKSVDRDSFAAAMRQAKLKTASISGAGVSAKPSLTDAALPEDFLSMTQVYGM
jgi:hypothetical protein